MSIIPSPPVQVEVSESPPAVTVSMPDDGPVKVTTQTAPATIGVTVPAGTVLVTTEGGGGSPVVGALSVPPNEVTVLGAPGTLGNVPAITETSTGTRVWGTEVPGMQFEPGMGPFFSQVLPDGTIAMPQMQLPISQTVNTGTTLSMGFWSPRENAFYSVKVPTSQGYTSVVAPGSDVGGADMSDCCVVTFDTIYGPETILFGLSALPYRGWNVATYGEWPVLAAFKRSATTGRWAYYPTRSIYASALRASDALYGAQAWPNTTNTYGETVTTTLLPCEVVTLPHSQHLAVAIYAPRSGRKVGAVSIIDPDAKEQVGYYEFPDWTSPSGGTLTAFPRDINADPTSNPDDERILLNLDTFAAPNETWNAVVWADGGLWRLSWGGTFTPTIALGADADEVQAALETISALTGKVTVRAYRPFLINTYTVYEVEHIGSMAHTDLSGTTATIDTSTLVNNGGSAIHRWKTGGASLTDSAWFPLVELSYNASSGVLQPVTAPMVPVDAIDSPRPESVDASFGMGWYDQDGNVWALVGGRSENPDNSTVFTFRGLHGWRKDPATGERRYVTDCPATGSWWTAVGSARPVPDVMTNGKHKQNGQFMLAIAEDQTSGGIVCAATSGRIKAALPTPNLARRSGNMLAAATPDDWTATGGHTGAWDATEGAFKLTAASTSNLEAMSPAGTAGIVIPESMIGELIQLELDVRAASTGRLTYPVVRFYNEAGTEISGLTGWGPATRITKTTYLTLVGSTVIPSGCRYIAAGISITGNASSEIHYVKRAELFVPGVKIPADVDMATNLLYSGSSNGAWLAKGFVDPHTRHWWLPYLQSVASGSAKNTVWPAWLVRADMARLFDPVTG